MFRELDYELQSAVLGPNAVSSIRTGRGFYVCTAKSRPWNSIRDILPPSREAYRLHLGPPEKRLRFIGLQASLLIRHALPTNSGVGDFSETLRVPLVPSKELRPLLKRVFFTPPPREFGLGGGGSQAERARMERSRVGRPSPQIKPSNCRHASRKVGSKRLLLRLQNRYPSVFGPLGAVTEIPEIAGNRDLFGLEAKRRVRTTVPVGTAGYVFWG